MSLKGDTSLLVRPGAMINLSSSLLHLSYLLQWVIASAEGLMGGEAMMLCPRTFWVPQRPISLEPTSILSSARAATSKPRKALCIHSVQYCARTHDGRAFFQKQKAGIEGWSLALNASLGAEEVCRAQGQADRHPGQSIQSGRLISEVDVKGCGVFSGGRSSLEVQDERALARLRSGGSSLGSSRA